MTFESLLKLLFLIYLTDTASTLFINVSSSVGAFIKFNPNPNTKEIIFKEPLNDRLTLSASFGEFQIKKELEGSKYKSIVFVDKQHLYMQSNIDSSNFTINAICQFDHENVAAYTFNQVCCQTSLTYGSLILSKKVCKLDISRTSSSCFQQMEISKKNFDFTNKEQIEITLNSRVFSSFDPNCSSEASSQSNMAKGLPQKILVSPELHWKWNIIDSSSFFGQLDIGIPSDSLELNSKTIFPLKIRSFKPLNSIDLKCSFGHDMILTAISFERSNFRGEFNPLNADHVVKITLHKIDASGSSNWNSLLGEHLVNLEIEVQRNTATVSRLIDCRVVSARLSNSNLARARILNEGVTSSVEVKINTEGFVIIPITMEKTYFSIFNRISGPIKLQKNDLKMFFVHNIKDGSFFEVTMKTACSSISNSSICCPEAQDSKNIQSDLTDPDWNLLLTMGSWQKLISYPIDVWRPEDWRTNIQDKTLNKVNHWRYFDRISQSCRPVYQVTRCQLLARIVKMSADTQKVYFGQKEPTEFPLFDLTTHLNASNIHLSSPNIKATLFDNSIFISPISPGVSDISILNHLGEKLGFDRITVSETAVSLTDLRVYCMHKLNATQAKNSYNPLFRSIIFKVQESKSMKENCHIQIKAIFSDKSVSDLSDYGSSVKVVFRSAEETVALSDHSSFVYLPHKYKEPGKFTIDLFETDMCPGSRLLFSKEVNLFNSPVDSTMTPSSVLRLDILSASLDKKPSSKIISTTEVKESKSVDTDSIFLSMKILIGLVGFVVLIVLLNCVLKLKQRKSVRLIDGQINGNPVYAPIDKLVNSTYSPLDVSNSIACIQQHPPLLPPPGPLYNASDSSQLDLTVNATPDIFWGLPHSGESMARNSHIAFALTPMHLQSRKASPSPHSESVDYVYVTNKVPTNSQNSCNKDSDSAATLSSGNNCSQIMMNVPPPCPPLRWNNSFCPNQFAMYYPCATDVTTEPSHHSHDNSSQGSLAPSHSSSYEIKQKPVLPPLGFSNSIDNVCEKSSGLGSLTSTKPESDCSKKDSGCPESPRNVNYFKSK